MVIYNTTNITEANHFIDILSATNDMSGSLLIGGFLLIMALVVFMSLKHHNTKAAMLATSTFITMISLLAWAMGWVGIPVIIWGIVFMLASFIMYIWNKP